MRACASVISDRIAKELTPAHTPARTQRQDREGVADGWVDTYLMAAFVMDRHVHTPLPATVHGAPLYVATRSPVVRKSGCTASKIFFLGLRNGSSAMPAAQTKRAMRSLLFVFHNRIQQCNICICIYRGFW